MHIQKHCKTYLPHFNLKFNSVTLENVQIPSSKSSINSYPYRISELTLGAEISLSEKSQFHI